MLKAVARHISLDQEWILLYVGRWLPASRIKIGYGVPDFRPVCRASAYPCRHRAGCPGRAARTDSACGENSRRGFTSSGSPATSPSTCGCPKEEARPDGGRPPGPAGPPGPEPLPDPPGGGRLADAGTGQDRPRDRYDAGDGEGGQASPGLAGAGLGGLP